MKPKEVRERKQTSVHLQLFFFTSIAESWADHPVSCPAELPANHLNLYGCALAWKPWPNDILTSQVDLYCNTEDCKLRFHRQEQQQLQPPLPMTPEPEPIHSAGDDEEDFKVCNKQCACASTTRSNIRHLAGAWSCIKIELDVVFWYGH
jgi:hypothetical protein